MITLQQVITINAISSAATGFLLTSLSKPISNLFEVEYTLPFTLAGIFLIVFGALAYIAKHQKPIVSSQIKLIILTDMLWVLGSFIALFMLFSTISVIGLVLISGVACWVATMAFLQYKCLNNLQRL